MVACRAAPLVRFLAPSAQSTGPSPRFAGLPHPLRSASRVSHPPDGFLLDRLPGLVSCQSAHGVPSLQSFSLARSRTASRRPDALLSLRTNRAYGPEGPPRRPGTTRSTDCLTSRKCCRSDTFSIRTLGPKADSRALLPEASPLRARNAFRRCVPPDALLGFGPSPGCSPSTPRPNRPKPAPSILPRAWPQTTRAPTPPTRRPEKKTLARIGALLGVLATSRLARARENTGRTLMRFAYLVRVLLDEGAASPWLCVHLGGRATSPWLREPLFGR